MVRVPPSTVDPARDAAALLRRLGLFVLLVGLPLGAIGSRNAVVVVFTVGAALAIAATTFDGARRPLAESLGGFLTTPAILSLCVLAGWTLLSLAWTRTPRPGSLPGTALVLSLALGVYLTMPDRMRAANLYLAPIGVMLAAVASMALVLTWSGEGDAEEVRRLERSAAVLVLLTWPAVAWVSSRGRDVEAVLLAILAGLSASLTPSPAPALAFATGAVAFLIAQAFAARGTALLGIGLAAAVALVPLLPVWGGPQMSRLSAWMDGWQIWRDLILHDPLRFVTGRGIGSLRHAGEPLRNAQLIGAPLLAFWYELGIVGALALASALATAFRDAAGAFKPLRPGFAALLGTATGLAVFGVDASETWWIATVSVALLAFVGAGRSQFRTRRPRALAFGAVKPT